jgi:hypothetical protein
MHASRPHAVRRRVLLLSLLVGAPAASSFTTAPTSSIARLTSIMRLGHTPRADVLLSETRRANILLSSAYLMPVDGKAITAHSTRDRVLALLEETRARRKGGERAMIVDVSATTWNWDTYAIVAGKPSPVAVAFSDEDELRANLPLEGDSKTVREGMLLPQPSGGKVWLGLDYG